MYLLEFIGRAIAKLVRQVWLLPQMVALGLRQRRGRLVPHDPETERLDRIRNPSKYLGH